MTMRPGIQRGQPPAFHELDEYTFQRLCNDLLAADPEVMTSNEYGTRGQPQYGLDLLATRYEGVTYDVGQCKCSRAFSASDIAAAVEAFFDHWDHWSTWQIKRFILFVACDLTSRQQRDALAQARQRFAEHNIRFVDWGATTIRNKLAPHRDIVARHLASEWVPIICGREWVLRDESTSGQTQAVRAYSTNLTGAAGAVLEQHLEKVAASLSSELRAEFTAQRETYREGRKREVQRWLMALRRDDARWLILHDDVKAQLLRYAALVELDLEDDTVEATALIEQAHRLDPAGNDRRIYAAIVARTEGLSAALDLISNETDTDSRNLCASFLIQQGDIAGARSVVEHLQEHRQADAETLRLRALIHLALREMEQAQLAIQKAREVAPKWLSIRWVTALIDYYSALSSAIEAPPLVAWPQPVDWAMIKRDDTSLARLRAAADVFHELASMPDPPDDRVNLSAWHLACLANDPDRQADAVRSCSRMLQQDPADYRAVMWAVSRSFPIELRPCERALNQLITQKRAEVAHVQALATCYIASNRLKKARHLLERTHALFTAAGADDVWVAWHVQVVARQGNRSELSQILSEGPTNPAKRTACATAVRRQAERDGAWEAFIDYCDRCYAETGSAEWLYECCEGLAYGEQWRALADRAIPLVEAVGTAQAVQIAAHALYMAQCYEQCLTLIEQQQGTFPQGRPPRELRRIRIGCQRMLGILSGAVAEAEALVRDEPSPQHVLALIQAYVDTGDLRKAALVAREQLQRLELPAENVLNVAQLVALIDHDLAVELWRRAVLHHETLEDDLIGTATGLGFQLGCENEMAPLMRRLHEIARAGRSGMQELSLSEAIDMLIEQRRRQNELNDMYRRGTVPNHMIADLQRWPLVTLYHYVLAANHTTLDPLRQFPVFLRHGGRPLAADFNLEGQPRLHLDVTALLLAAHLELLEIIGQTFGPLHIPADLIAALIAMQVALADHQVTTTQAAQQIQALVDQQQMYILDSGGADADSVVPALGTEWNRLYNRTRQLNGYLVDHLPKRDPDDIETVVPLPNNVARYVCNPRALIEALRRGPYSDSEYVKARNALGSEGHEPSSSAIAPLGATIVLAGNVPETLARAQILDDIVRHFRVWIEADELARVRATIQSDAERHALQEWLGGVLEHIRRGISDGQYRVVPFPAAAMEPDDTNRHLSANDRCLFTLLLYHSQPNDIVWIDDRFATRYLHRDGIPIVGMSDVLHWLHRRGAISEADYYDKLLALRAGNARYLPLDADEVLDHLRAANVGSDGVIETRALQVLRRYLAACMAQGELLQPPSVDESGGVAHGELPFLMNSRRVAVEAMRRAWLSSTDATISRSRSEWVYTNLYLDTLSIREFIAHVQTLEEQRLFLSLDLVDLLITAKPTHLGVHPEVQSEQAYHDWVVERILVPRCASDPLLPASIAERIKSLLAAYTNGGGEEQEHALAMFGAQGLYQALPKIIRHELENDHEFMAQLGYFLVLMVQVGEYSFERQAFLHAVTEAVNNRAALLNPHNTDLEFPVRLCRNANGSVVVCFEDSQTNARVTIPDPTLLLAHESPTEREAILRRNRHWFERPQVIVERLIASIASLGEVEHRIAEADTWRGRSASVFYETLLSALQARDEISYDGLIPPFPDEILWYLRLDPSTLKHHEFAQALAGGTETLIADVGLAMAIERLAGLPIALPEVVLDSVTQLSPSEQRVLLKRLLRQAGSPVSLLHVIRIAVHLKATSTAIRRLVRRLVHGLLTPERIESIEVFLTVLRWVDIAMGRRPVAQSWSPAERLAVVWSHTHSLYRTCTTAGVSPEQLSSWFGSRSGRISPELFIRNSLYWADNAHPHRVYPVGLLLDGLAYALADAADVYSSVLRADMTALVLPLQEDQLLRDVQILEVPSSQASTFPSFLGVERERAVMTLLEEEAGSLLSPKSLQEHLEAACDRLVRAQGETLDWSLVLAVLNDRAPHPVIAEQLTVAIGQSDFVDLFVRDARHGLLAIRAASRQARYLPNNVQQHIRDSLIAIARRVGAQMVGQAHSLEVADETSEEQPDARGALLEVAQTLTLAYNPATDAMQFFTMLMIEIIAVWPQFVPWCRPIVQRLWEELPMDQAHELWPLVLRLRAA